MATTVSFQGSRDDLRRSLQRLPQILSGRAPDPHGLARGLQLRLGTALLSKVQQAFITKARGGTGDDGIKWEPLKYATIRARRKGKSEDKVTAQVEILRDTGELFRSLSPGVEATPSNAPGQVFAVPPGRVIVGTNKKPWHHRGVPGKLPARPLWPKQLPDAWWRAIMGAYRRGLVKMLVELLTRGVLP